MKKKIFGILAAIVLAMGVAIPVAFAAPKVPDPTLNIGDKVETTITNAGFHCGTFGGNGRVWVEDYDNLYELAKKNGDKGVQAELIRVTETEWLLAAISYKNEKKGIDVRIEVDLEVVDGEIITGENLKCPDCGSNLWVSFSNMSGIPDGKNMQFTHWNPPPPPPPDDPTPKGTLTVEKWVGGANIMTWLVNDYTGDWFELLESMTFELYAVAGNGAPWSGTPIDVVIVNGAGQIAFGEVDAGWYAIVEKFTAPASDIFNIPDALYVYVGAGIADAIIIGGGGEGSGRISVIDFDYDAFYTIVNGYGAGYVLGYPGLNNSGDIFYIGVTNTTTGEEYASFCANAGSRAFAGQSGLGCAGYLVAENFRDDADLSDFVSAYNYILDTYGEEFGNLNDLRGVTQIITWYLLEGGMNLDLINWAAVEAGTAAIKGIPGAKAIVEDVIANYEGYKSTNANGIVDVVYMTCEHNHAYADCQPQLVPIYAKTTIFENALVKADE